MQFLDCISTWLQPGGEVALQFSRAARICIGATTGTIACHVNLEFGWTPSNKDSSGGTDGPSAISQQR